jgi:hypothetical protein
MNRVVIEWTMVLAAFLTFAPVQAGCYKNCTTNNYYPTEEITLLSGMSDSDINQVITGVMAGGAHQFDFSTTHWQLSLTGAVNMSDWDEDANYSIGVGKRFGKDHWMPNALWHLEYTPIEEDDYVTFGGTIVFD